MAKAPIHLNSNIFAAISVATTGPYIGVHDIWQICILPLDSTLEAVRPLQPFYLDLKPIREKDNDCKISNENWAKASVSGVDRDLASTVLEQWFNKLMAGVPKRIVPVSANWHKIGGFIYEWL